MLFRSSSGPQLREGTRHCPLLNHKATEMENSELMVLFLCWIQLGTYVESSETKQEPISSGKQFIVKLLARIFA